MSTEICIEPSLYGKSVILADNNLDLRRITAVTLRRIGIKVDETSGGNDAIRLVRNNHYDVILTSLHMLMGDGYSLIGGIPPHMRPRVVIMTSDPIMLDRAAGAAAFGVRFVLPKPYAMMAIIQAVKLATVVTPKAIVETILVLPDGLGSQGYSGRPDFRQAQNVA